MQVAQDVTDAQLAVVKPPPEDATAAQFAMSTALSGVRVAVGGPTSVDVGEPVPVGVPVGVPVTVGVCVGVWEMHPTVQNETQWLKAGLA
jgi:hypothetical protein